MDFTTYRIPDEVEALTHGLDPKAWEPELDITNPLHRLQLALADGWPLAVPSWDDLGFEYHAGNWRHGVPPHRGVQLHYDAEVEQRRGTEQIPGMWEVWIDVPDFDCPSFATDIEARVWLGQLAEWSATTHPNPG